MDEDEILGVHQVANVLWSRIHEDGEQPTREIAELAEQTFDAATATTGACRWHEHMLDALVRALNDHRRARRANDASIFMLTVALNDVVGLATPISSVLETLREPADPERVAALLAEIRTWR